MIIVKPAAVQPTSEACVLVGNGANNITQPCSLMPPISPISPICSLVKFCTNY